MVGRNGAETGALCGRLRDRRTVFSPPAHIQRRFYMMRQGRFPI